MKRTAFTMLASVPYIIFRVIGETFGQSAADLFYWVQSSVMHIESDMFVEIGAPILAGILGGALAALGCFSLYRYYSIKVMLIIPGISTAFFVLLGTMSLLNNDFSWDGVGQFIAQFVALYVFYVTLKGKFPSKYIGAIEGAKV